MSTLATHVPFLGCVLRTQMGYGPLSCCGTQRREETLQEVPALLWSQSHTGKLRSWTGRPLPCCWDTFVPVNNGPRALVIRACGKARPDMENQRREATRPSVPSGTLELYFPDHLYRWVPAFGASLHPHTKFPYPLTCNPSGWDAGMQGVVSQAFAHPTQAEESWFSPVLQRQPCARVPFTFKLSCVF